MTYMSAAEEEKLFARLHRLEASENKLAEVEHFRIEDVGKYRELMAELRDLRAAVEAVAKDLRDVGHPVDPQAVYDRLSSILEGKS